MQKKDLIEKKLISILSIIFCEIVFIGIKILFIKGRDFMRKIIVRIQGGLGNQLFQYAFAKHLFKEGKFDKIVLDVSYYNKKHIRDLELDEYDLDKNVQISDNRRVLVDFIYFLYRCYNKIIRYFPNGKTYFFLKGVNSQLWLSDKTIGDYSINKEIEEIYLIGYYQDLKLVQDVADELREEIKFLNNPSKEYKMYMKQIQDAKETIAISIRMGEDYKRFGWPVCEKEYYLSGLDYILKTKAGKVFVFSDCIEKVKKEKWFADYAQVVYVNGVKATESLSLMMNCKDFIISNSTFAWWGAFLSENHNKTIIAPSYFYRNKRLKSSALEFENMFFYNNFDGKFESSSEVENVK